MKYPLWEVVVRIDKIEVFPKNPLEVKHRTAIVAAATKEAAGAIGKSAVGRWYNQDVHILSIAEVKKLREEGKAFLEETP